MTRKKWIMSIGAFIVVVLLIAVIVGSTAPGNFSVGGHVSIKKGASLTQTANLLKDQGFIRSTTLFKVYAVLLGYTKGVKAGNYFFADDQSALRIAYRVVKGQQGIPVVKVTIPEGLASSDIARLIKREIPTFDSVRFLILAKPLEGFLFPDTYFWDEFTTPEDVIAAMRSNFDDHTDSIAIPPELGGKSFKEIVTMASLLEEEATSTLDRRIIAGILWKRIQAKMALQVDAPFFYILGKTSAQLTVADLATSSPYNLYKHTGLPPTPIDNPSLDAIVAAVHPIETKNWFFLAGSNGKTYYAENLAGHLANMKYLK